MNTKNMSEEMASRNTTGKRGTGNDMQTQLSSPRATQIERAGSGKKNFPIGWLLSVAALSLFLGHFWSYIPVVRGIVSLFIFSKFLAGLCGTHFLL